MIRYLSLFLGLVHGVQTVELEVQSPIATVELRLDGEPAGTLTGPPWAIDVDLGATLLPHELEAIGYDADGRRLGRARRWINLELPEGDGAEATAVAVVLDEGVELPPAAGMQGWFSAGGEPLEVLRSEAGEAEVVLVRDPTAQWRLDEQARFFLELTLGAPAAPELWDPRVLGLGREAFIEHAGQAWAELFERLNARRLSSGVWQPGAADLMLGALWDRWHGSLRLAEGTSYRFLSPQTGPVSQIESPMDVFQVTTRLPNHDTFFYEPEKGLLWMAVESRPLEPRLRLADAVAVAGLESHATGRRRAVVLMLHEGGETSFFAPPQARDYLAALQVPLVVWSFAGHDPGGEPAEATASGELRQVFVHPGWGIVRRLGPDRGELLQLETQIYLARLETALGDLHRRLAAQRIVWLAGLRSPSGITLAPQVAGVRLAGAPPQAPSMAEVP